MGDAAKTAAGVAQLRMPTDRHEMQLMAGCSEPPDFSLMFVRSDSIW
jgi:hypothetical protein